MPTKSYSLVKGRRARATRVDACGRPVFGEYSQAVTSGFISAAVSAITSETDEVSVTNANGDRCVYEPAETSIAGYGVELTMCDVDPDLFSMFTGQPVYTDAFGNVIGIKINTKLAVVNTVSFELWAGVANADTCSDPGAAVGSGYILLPFLKGGYLSDFTVENGAVSFVITGMTSREGHSWGVGPYNVIRGIGGVAGPLPTPLEPNDALLSIIVDVAPPEPFVGSRPLLDPSQEALTSVTGVVVGDDATFTVAPDDIVAPAWYDFGDGTWDYVASAAMGSTTHEYAEPGTYTVTASTNGVIATTTVTIAA